MNDYAVIAFVTPVVAAALGWAAVILHEKSLRHSRKNRAAAADNKDQRRAMFDQVLRTPTQNAEAVSNTVASAAVMNDGFAILDLAQGSLFDSKKHVILQRKYFSSSHLMLGTLRPFVPPSKRYSASRNPSVQPQFSTSEDFPLPVSRPNP